LNDAPASAGLLRLRTDDGHARVTYVELFFDLVFVFAITQLSHGLLHHFDALGAAQTVVLFLAVWWVWIYTAWATNWCDPERAGVRFLLFAMMLGGLVMAVAIPDAFGAMGLAFGIAYPAMQMGRTAFLLRAIPRDNPALRLTFVRMLAWMGTAAPFWLAGGLAEGPWRLGLWIVALGIEYAAPAVGYRTPRLGRSSTTDWNVAGGHMAERCALFVIIALGESLVVTGAAFQALAWSAANLGAFAAAFAGSLAMWWVYFHTGEERATRHIAASDDPGRIARLCYTYLHMPIIAGIVLTAVADAMMLREPLGPASAGTVVATLGGPALYLAGLALFKRVTLGNLPLSHLVGLGLLALAAAFAAGQPVVGLGAAATGILVLVAAWEHVSLRGGRARHAA
jgi:low temperature requirement protein LtrA